MLRDLRLRNQANGFEDSSFHSEDFDLDQQNKYKKEEREYAD